MRGAGHRCGEAAAPPTIDVWLTAQSTPVALVVDPDARASASARCVEDELARMTLPAWPPALRSGVRATVVLGPLDLGFGRAGDDDPLARSPRTGADLGSPLAAAAVVFARPRRGAMDSIALGLHGLTTWPVGGLRLVAAGELEAGVDGELDGTFAARTMAGLGVRLPRHVGLVAVVAGLGASRAGHALPGALEVPLEVRVRVAAGGYRVHGWMRASLVRGEPARDAVELELGAGVSLPRHLGRFFLGAAVEHVVVGTSGSVCFGVPFGGF